MIKKFVYNLKPRFSVTEVPKICSWVDSVLYKNSNCVYSTNTLIKKGTCHFGFNDVCVSEENSTNFKNDCSNFHIRISAQNRGRLMEALCRSHVNQFECKNFTKDNSIKKLNLGRFEISGTVDGINSDQKEIVEIKTRKYLKSNLKFTISKSEKMKLFCYMKLWNVPNCYYAVFGPLGYFEIHLFKWNETFWNYEIYEKLEIFTNKLFLGI